MIRFFSLSFSPLTDTLLGHLLAISLVGFTIFVLLLWRSSRKQRYWKEVGIPYAKPFPFFGSVLDNVRKPLQETERERYNKYGNLYGHYEGNRPLLSVGDPDLLRDILVKDFHAFTGRRRISTNDKIIDSMMSLLQGEDWKRVRTIVTPTFTTGKIKRMMSIFKECSQTLVNNFKRAAEEGKPIDGKSLYGAFTMDIIASSAFSTKIDSHNDPDNEFVAAAKGSFSRTLNWRILLFFLMPSVVKLLRIKVFAPKTTEFFTKVTLQIIEERRRTGQKRNDFLQLLLDTANELSEEGKLDLKEKDDIVENYGKEDGSEIFKPAAFAKKTLSQEELIGQCVIFFVAGYETTNTTLSLVSYLLALNPEIQETLIEELDNALRENNGELTYEAVQGMKYLDNVISETLRIYSPGIRLERQAEEDYKLGNTGIIIPKGMVVTIPVFAIHRDPKYYPDPEIFDPNRFTPEERTKRPQYAYLPFGSGPRNCVAMRFALMEMKVCLAHVLSNFRIKRCPQTKVPLEFYIGQQGILQPKAVNFTLEVRKNTLKAL